MLCASVGGPFTMATAYALSRAIDARPALQTVVVECLFEATECWEELLTHVCRLRQLRTVRLNSTGLEQWVPQAAGAVLELISNNPQLRDLHLGAGSLKAALTRPGLHSSLQVPDELWTPPTSPTAAAAAAAIAATPSPPDSSPIPAPVLARLVAHYSAQRDQPRKEYRAKVVFVGFHAAGKTSLLRALRREVLDKHDPTAGIEIDDWVLPLQDGRLVRLSTWDFAGQESYYYTHSLFLSRNCVFVLAWDPRPSELKNQQERNGVHYWLRSIAAIDPQATVLVVATRLDVQAAATSALLSDKAERKLDEEFGQPVGRMSLHHARVGSNKEYFRHKPTHNAAQSELVARLDGLRTTLAAVCASLGEYEATREQLAFATAVDNQRPWLNHLVPTEVVKGIATRCGVPDAKLDDAVNKLVSWGSLLRYSEASANLLAGQSASLTDLCVLEPHWLSEVARRLVGFPKDKGRWDGTLSRRELEELWPENLVPRSEFLDVLYLMHRFELSFGLYEQNELVPALLHNATPSEKEELNAAADRQLQDILTAEQGQSVSPPGNTARTGSAGSVASGSESGSNKRKRAAPRPLLQRRIKFQLSFTPATLMGRIIFTTHKFTVRHSALLHSCWADHVVLWRDAQVATISLSVPKDDDADSADDRKQQPHRQPDTAYVQRAMRSKHSGEVVIEARGDAPDGLCGLLADMVLKVIRRYDLAHVQQLAGCTRHKRPQPLSAPGPAQAVSDPGDCPGWVPISLPDGGVAQYLTCSEGHRVPVDDFIRWVGVSFIGGVEAAVAEAAAELSDLSLPRASSARARQLHLLHRGACSKDPGPRVSPSEVEQMQRSALNYLQLLLPIKRSPRPPASSLLLLRPSGTQTAQRRGRDVWPPNVLNASTGRYQLFLLCEQPGAMHVQQQPGDPSGSPSHSSSGGGGGGSQQLPQPTYIVNWGREHWQRFGPLLYFVAEVVRLTLRALPPNSPATRQLPVSAEELAALQSELRRLCEQQIDSMEAERAAVQALGEWWRSSTPAELQAGKGLNSLHYTELPSGERCWLCADHNQQARSAQVLRDFKIVDSKRARTGSSIGPSAALPGSAPSSMDLSAATPSFRSSASDPFAASLDVEMATAAAHTADADASLEPDSSVTEYAELYERRDELLTLDGRIMGFKFNDEYSTSEFTVHLLRPSHMGSSDAADDAGTETETGMEIDATADAPSELLEEEEPSLPVRQHRLREPERRMEEEVKQAIRRRFPAVVDKPGLAFRWHDSHVSMLSLGCCDGRGGHQHGGVVSFFLEVRGELWPINSFHVSVHFTPEQEEVHCASQPNDLKLLNMKIHAGFYRHQPPSHVTAMYAQVMDAKMHYHMFEDRHDDIVTWAPCANTVQYGEHSLSWEVDHGWFGGHEYTLVWRVPAAGGRAEQLESRRKTEFVDIAVGQPKPVGSVAALHTIFEGVLVQDDAHPELPSLHQRVVDFKSSAKPRFVWLLSAGARRKCHNLDTGFDGLSLFNGAVSGYIYTNALRTVDLVKEGDCGSLVFGYVHPDPAPGGVGEVVPLGIHFGGEGTGETAFVAPIEPMLDRALDHICTTSGINHQHVPFKILHSTDATTRQAPARLRPVMVQPPAVPVVPPVPLA